MAPLRREASVETRTTSKSDGIWSANDDTSSASSDQSTVTCETNQQDDNACSQKKEEYSYHRGIISESEHDHDHSSKVKIGETLALPIETTSLLLSGRFKDDGDASNRKPIAAASAASNEGWTLLMWWLCRIILPLALIAWCCTRSTLIVVLSMISIPALAIVQGSLAILRYRHFHGDCPVPKTPSQGIVQILDHATKQTEEKTELYGDERKRPDTTAPPLRLLVLGDSLAVGVGQSLCSTPILPETVAESLSKALGGRPVLWTCHGAPGASTGWLVQEIEQCRQHSSGQPSPATDDSHNDLDIAGTNAWNNPDIQTINAAHVAEERELDAVSHDCTEVDQELRTWRKQLHEHSFHVDHFDASNIGGPFDIVIILTGSNDLKSTFFPFLLSGEDAKFRNEAFQRGGGYGKELTRLLHALNQRMRWRLQTLQESIEGVTQQVMNHFGSIDRAVLHDDCSSTCKNLLPNDVDGRTCSTMNNDGVCLPQFPLVVLPGMPARTLPIFSAAPLKWLAVPIVDTMDNHKRRLAQQHQGEVLFVEAPTKDQILEYTDGNGEYSKQDKGNYIVRRHRSITSRDSRRIESEMLEYYSQPSQNKKLQFQSASNRHFDIFSVDGIHPNDTGYKFWGRHIAHHIIQEWKNPPMVF